MRRRVGVTVGRRRRLTLAATDRTEDESASRKEWTSEQRRAARVATEAAVGRVPVLTLVRHLPWTSQSIKYQLHVKWPT